MKDAALVLLFIAAGAVARDLFVGHASADADVVTRGDVNAIVRALEAQARATADVARAVQDAGRCR